MTTNNGLRKLTKLLNQIYRTGEWPKDFLDITMIVLQKNPKANKRSDHRTISLISHTGKVVAKILTRPLKNKIEQYMSEDQFGFRKRRGTRDAIGILRIMSNRCLDVKQNIYFCL
ncbi:uncharacterized protein LOC113380301 [Ctenocephalides felis]|uniref:uncharacterized protein LOC113380301 n=1 Tax=Ctenocephalides felis TaxID=7515 RepID=UPI000E6E52EF|nr:uncharacterized protein LOC113380301 [Ctenocephalides felis]